MSGLDEALSSITHQLQSAVSSNDRSQVFQLLPNLLQSLPVSPHQRHLPATQGLRLLQLGAQGLNLSTGNLQVCHNLYVSNILVSVTEHSYTVDISGSASWLPSPQSRQSGHHWFARS